MIFCPTKATLSSHFQASALTVVLPSSKAQSTALVPSPRIGSRSRSKARLRANSVGPSPLVCPWPRQVSRDRKVFADRETQALANFQPNGGSALHSVQAGMVLRHNDARRAVGSYLRRPRQFPNHAMQKQNPHKRHATNDVGYLQPLGLVDEKG
jgi:hypothetical protein